MTDFPPFMKSPANRIAASSQHTPGVEGYIFEGADGTQMAFWTVERDAITAEHVHEFDEWFLVVEGSYTLTLNGEEVRVGAGQDCFIPKGTRTAGRVSGGTRTIHAFGGRLAERALAVPEPKETHQPMSTISKAAKLVTFINVFTVEPTNQQRLVELLARVTDTSVRHAPGFVSSALHRSLDGTKVTMYAQWRTIEDYEAMRKDPTPLPYLQQALTIAKFEPRMYEVVESFVPGDGT
jgi:quinol monooxygenase YgiN/uncharacterized cupin superfamily protein